jgi:uncharacterized membrane protein YGL010W
VKTLTDHLSQYAAYHRDRRNVATHLVGIPLIVFAVMVLASRPALFQLGAAPVTPAVLASIAAVAWYVSLDRPLGLLMAVVLAALLALAAPLAAAGTASWLGWGLGLFVLGWIVQFVGHAYEGRKPAFVDDLTGLAVGPLFVAAEVVFALGLRRALRDEVERRAGPARTGTRGGAAA